MSVLQAISVPIELQRNAPDVLAAGLDHTGEILILHTWRRETLHEC
jgi:hypothetical protein